MFSFLSKPKRIVSQCVAICATLWLAACQPVSTTGGPSIDTKAPVPVALLVPGGSAKASDNMIAKNLENAARMAISDLHGVKIDLKVYNTAGNPAQAAQVATEAVKDGAKIIIGPLYAEAANAVGVAVAKRNVNVLAFSNNTAIAGRNVFVLGHTFQNTANRLVGYAKRKGLGRIMVVHAKNPAGMAGKDAVLKAISAQGAVYAGIGSYEFSQNGITAAVPNIARSIRNTGSQSVFFTADTAGALPMLTQMLPDQGISPSTTKFIGLTRWDIPPATLALPGLQGGWYAVPHPGMITRFNARYNAAYGNPPHPTASLAYDGIAAIGALVKAGRPNALAVSGLTQGSGFVGANGIFRLFANGTNQRGLAVVEIRDRQPVIIDPAPSSFGGAGS